MTDGFPRCPRCGRKVMGLVHGLCWVCDYEKGHPGAVRQYCRDCIHWRDHDTYDRDLPGHSCHAHLEAKDPGQFHYECRDYRKRQDPGSWDWPDGSP